MLPKVDEIKNAFKFKGIKFSSQLIDGYSETNCNKLAYQHHPLGLYLLPKTSSLQHLQAIASRTFTTEVIVVA